MDGDDRDDRERLPLPSEDTGDLLEEPSSGQTDDPLVAQEEGIPYVPPADRVLSATRMGEAGPDEAGTAPSDAGELERRDAVQPGVAAKPRDDELLADCLEALRASNLPAGDRIRLSVNGSTVVARGEVESIDVLDEILGLLGEVRGVENVVDEIQVQGI